MDHAVTRIAVIINQLLDGISLSEHNRLAQLLNLLLFLLNLTHHSRVGVDLGLGQLAVIIGVERTLLRLDFLTNGVHLADLCRIGLRNLLISIHAGLRTDNHRLWTAGCNTIDLRRGGDRGERSAYEASTDERFGKCFH